MTGNRTLKILASRLRRRPEGEAWGLSGWRSRGFQPPSLLTSAPCYFCFGTGNCFEECAASALGVFAGPHLSCVSRSPKSGSKREFPMKPVRTPSALLGRASDESGTGSCTKTLLSEECGPGLQSSICSRHDNQVNQTKRHRNPAFLQ